MKKLKEVVAQRRAKVVVCGDIMIDEFVHGEVTRLSPESIAPVFRTNHGDDVFHVPGGAANVARQLRHWNADVRLAGLMDVQTAEMMYAGAGLDCRASILVYGPRTPIKRRLIADGRDVLRWDIEQPWQETKELQDAREKLTSTVKLLVDDGYDLVIFSDYRKGTFTAKEIDIFREQLAPVTTVIDTKQPSMWRGVGYTKCNQHETSAGTARVVTRGALPPLVDEKPVGQQLEVPVRSVAGAGDCFTAVLGRLVAAGASLRESAAIAHQAGAVYVQQIHNRPVHPWQVSRMETPAAKIMAAADVSKMLQVLFPDKRVVFTNGCFDVFHAGHLATIEWAKRQGDILVVGVNDDQGVRTLKGRDRPITPLYSRTAVLAGLEAVDFVVPFSGTPLETIRTIGPDMIVKGPDYRGRMDEIVGKELVKDVRIANVPEAALHSSSVVERLISQAQ